MKAKMLRTGRCGALTPGHRRGCDAQVVRVEAWGYQGIGRMSLTEQQEHAILLFNEDGTSHAKPVGATDETMRQIWQDSQRQGTD